MRARNHYSRRENEPEIIAISAAREQNALLPVWFTGLAVFAYLGCALLLQ